MLTVDYGRLGLKPGDRVLDLGCGFGRHAYEVLRRGAAVVACDLGIDELRQVRGVVAAMYLDGEIPETASVGTAAGDATSMPFDDDSFDHVIASEVLEHIHDDDGALAELTRVLRPGGTLATTVPAALPERICWALSEDYHAPNTPGGHVRIYRRSELHSKMSGAGLVPVGSHRAHALHSPYWWLRCAVGPDRAIEDSRLVSLYHRLLTWDIVKAPRVTRLTERLLNPVLGKSLVMYATKPVSAATADSTGQARELSHVST
ncbi:MAG: class I SAM-dependent methyltransferase [Actinobacteria bacterium]|nr:class I SAM-dependent methyltransferase [Actinomycetota bacterium]MBT3686787.1 class I SAM-dependent methyltransferase [Actinomycetota bacterium]MBT4037124.1 class I SAM-dependent methyltransferase [Actinomycetota bacterium]MBT4278152.1 class I SAM-dependent methyltransferase [Actinomycetota bacterium]MBT4343796.1 class I SAM-dependent methyltransferase [Actinomycetota bacterium]